MISRVSMPSRLGSVEIGPEALHDGDGIRGHLVEAGEEPEKDGEDDQSEQNLLWIPLDADIAGERQVGRRVGRHGEGEVVPRRLTSREPQARRALGIRRIKSDA
jgi:hypothetical protein